MDPVLRILIVEDSEDDTLLLIRKITQGGYQPDWVRVCNEKDMRKYLCEEDWDLVISDFSMPTFDGLTALSVFKQMALDIPFILVSGTIGEDVAVTAMKAGAHDYLMKDHLERLVPAIKRELGETEVRRERTKAIDLLREREKFLTTVIENIPHVIFIKDAKDLKFVRINKAGEDLIGLTRDVIIGKSDYDYYPEEKADFIVRQDRDILKRGVLVDIPEEIVPTQDKGDRILRTKKIPIMDENGEPLFLFGISEDITEQKAKEAREIELKNQLRQAQKMEAIGTLAGGIAHDFNNILASIIGYSELAKMDIDDIEKNMDNLDKILQAGLRARDLVKQILIFSRQADIIKEPMQIIPLLKEIYKLLRASLPSTIEIRQQFPSSHSTILADPTQIYQVVMNLCTNAAYAMKEKGGEIDIRLSDFEPIDDNELAYKGLLPGDYLELTVSDTGTGIPEDIIENIFNPFFTTKERGEGTGMGLSVVHGIVKDMGGNISVSSRLGEGATFRVIFPKYDDDVIDNEAAYSSPQSGRGSILFVDDEEAIVASACGILENLGYRVVSTTDPFGALKLFKEKMDEIDLVLTDMTMPQMTGLELADRISLIKPDIPIVLCTGFGLGLTEDIVQNPAIKKLVMKPMVAGELANAVYTILHQPKTTG